MTKALSKETASSPPYRRPWWLIVNKSARLITTVHEEVRPGERVFVVRGEPSVQGLGWLTWGPVGALVVILILAGLAVALEISKQGWAIKALFIVAFLALPALVWGLVSFLLTRISASLVQAERQAEAQECMLRLDHHQRQLTYRTTPHASEVNVAYQDIRQARVAHPIGGRDSNTVQLTLETHNGPVILLGEALGTLNQKMDLAQLIQQALNDYPQP
jgi:hypothetical protein